MTQEEKELLLKDLCARLSYGVHVEISWEYSKEDVYTSSEYYEFPNIDSLLNIFWDEKCVSIKPYLRPMSSMTEEEKNEIRSLLDAPIEIDSDGDIIYLSGCCLIPCSDFQIYIDYLNSHHFDYRGLIPMDLALEAPKGMYK